MGIPHHGRTSVASAEHWRTPSVHAARVLHVHVGNINGLECRAFRRSGSDIQNQRSSWSKRMATVFQASSDYTHKVLP